MGNRLLSECRYGATQYKVESSLPNMEPMKNQSYKPKVTSNYEFQQIIKSLPQKSTYIQSIYKRLIQEKRIGYSIQNEQFLYSYGIKSLKQLQNDLLEASINFPCEQQKRHQKGNQYNSKFQQSRQAKQLKNLNNALESETLSQKSIQKRKNIQIKIIQFSLRMQTFKQNQIEMLDSINRARSFSSKSQQFFLQSSIEQKYINIFSKEKFQIFNKKCIYVGFLNQNFEPHGAGQLYHYEDSINNALQKRDYLKSQTLKFFIQSQFVNGYICSQDSIIIFQDGSHYRGGYLQNSFHGKGLLKMSYGYELFGNFISGYLSGKGKAKYQDGGCYQGYFKFGLRQGRGKMTWKSLKNKQTESNSLEIVYQGFFQKDKMNGLGYLKTPNYQYWGPFADNMKEGKGTIKFKDGNKYQGWFQKDQIHGYGELHYSDGKIQKGIFPVTKQ